MRVLLGLSGMELSQSRVRKHGGERDHRLRRKGDEDVREADLVVSHRHECQPLRPPLADKAAEVVLHESPRQLARAVRPEVEEDHRIAVLDARAFADEARLHQFIPAFRIRVAFTDRVGWARARRRLRVDDRVPRALRPVPTLVAVHRPVASLDRRHGRLDSGQQFERAARRHVSSVEVQVYDVPHALTLRKTRERIEMAQVGMHATRREEAHEVQRPACAHRIDRATEGGVLHERPIGDRVVDANELLVLHVAGAHGQMPDLAVPHDAIG